MLSDAEAGMLVRKAIKVSGEVHCPVCGQPIFEKFTVCPSCETPHHPDCWSYNQRCATYGCQPVEALQVVVPKEEAEVLLRELALYRSSFRRWKLAGTTLGALLLAVGVRTALVTFSAPERPRLHRTETSAAEPRSAPRPRRPDNDMESIRPLLARFPFRAEAGAVTVWSNISAAFTQEHAQHGERAWHYFSRVFRGSPGNKTAIYYTRDRQVYEEIAQHTLWPQTWPNDRFCNAIWHKNHRMWFIIPEAESDFGGLIYDLSRDFIYFTFPLSEAHPWFTVGASMYWQSGRWDARGDLVVTSAMPDHLVHFKGLASERKLVPLSELLTMDQNTFYRHALRNGYAQTMMLFHYLMKRQHAAMKNVFANLNNGTITDNRQLLESLQAALKMDLATLDREYVAFGQTMTN